MMTDISQLRQQLHNSKNITLNKSYTPTHSIDLNINAVTTDLGRLYTVDGQDYLPSITTVLGHKKFFESNDFLDTTKRLAAAVGTTVHDSIETLLLTGSVTVEDPGAANNIKSFFPLLTSIEEVVLIESPLYSSTLGVAGRCDLVAKISGKTFLIDFKNITEYNEDYHRSYFLQLQAYQTIIEELTDIYIDGWILAVCESGKFNPIITIEYIFLKI